MISYVVQMKGVVMMMYVVNKEVRVESNEDVVVRKLQAVLAVVQQ